MWLTIVIDGLLTLTAISMIDGNFDHRYMATEAGRDAFRGDLAIHAAALFLHKEVTGRLLLARNQFITNNAN